MRFPTSLLFALLATGGLAACAPSPSLVGRLAERHPEVVFSFATLDSLVALTLDDGPSANATPEVLRLLRAHDARATFFLTGERIPGREGLVRQIVDQGHELGNHGMTMTPSVLLPADTFRRHLHEADSLLREHGPVRWFRPATGFFNARIRAGADSLGYGVALGSVYPNDVHRPLAGVLAGYILRHVEPGAVIVLHEGETGKRTVGPVLERVLPELRRRGYRVVTLSELAAAASP
jgi:peptidoglycan-N-acetylglucosamine deacetylase